ncbi:13806_t:CDS:2, partial [Dentiscutata erythropus]
RYNPVNDESFKTKYKPFGYAYFGGNVYGIRGTASFNISGYTPGYILGQNFGLVNVLPKSFENDEFDGILGLATSNEFVELETNVYQNILHDYETKNAIFSLKIGREADEMESELIIGGIDQSKYTGELVSTQIFSLSHIYWSIRLDGFSINVKSLEFQGHIRKIVSGISSIIVKIKIGNVDWDIDPRDLIDIQQLRNRETCSGMIISGITEGFFHLTEEYVNALKSLIDIPEAEAYMRTQVFIAPMDYPGQLYIQCAITRCIKLGDSSEILEQILHVVPMIGPLHVFLNSCETVFLLNYHFFDILFHAVFGHNKMLAKKPKPYKINLILELA